MHHLFIYKVKEKRIKINLGFIPNGDILVGIRILCSAHKYDRSVIGYNFIALISSHNLNVTQGFRSRFMIFFIFLSSLIELVT